MMKILLYILLLQVSSGDECVVLDSSPVTRWRVCSSTGHEGLVPAICFHFAPPSSVAVDAVSRYCALVILSSVSYDSVSVKSSFQWCWQPRNSTALYKVCWKIFYVLGFVCLEWSSTMVLSQGVLKETKHFLQCVSILTATNSCNVDAAFSC